MEQKVTLSLLLSRRLVQLAHVAFAAKLAISLLCSAVFGTVSLTILGTKIGPKTRIKHIICTHIT